MALPQPTKTRIRACTINGINVVQHVNSISVFESVCKPYITATMEMLDKDNIINKLRLVGGEQVYFAFDGNFRRIYEMTLFILSISEITPNPSLRSANYKIELIGRSYFNDRVNLVQQSFKGVTGTDAINIIHNSYVGGDAPFSILSPSLGLLSKDNPYNVQSTKPFKAIDDIRRTLNFARYSTGNSLYYRAYDNYVLAPLEQLFDQLTPQDSFIQKSTWGRGLSDYVLGEKSIMDMKLDVHWDKKGVGELASVANQGKVVFDLNLMKEVVNILPKTVSPGKVVGTALVQLLGNAFQGKTNGGEPNFQVMDTYQRRQEADTSAKTERERLYAATAKSGPRIKVKVPIQGGVNCTVGRGVYLDLVPPTGDDNSVRPNLYKGNWLVIDLTHEVKNYGEVYEATTTMNCIRGGVN